MRRVYQEKTHNCLDHIDECCCKCLEEGRKKQIKKMRKDVLDVIKNYTGMKNDFLEGLAHDIGKVMDQYKW